MAITGFDHFIILVNDLNAAMDAYRRIGFAAQVGGEHVAFGSRNALVALSDGSYLELVAYHDPALAMKTFWGDAVRKLQVREGFGAFVLASNDIENDVRQIRQRGLEIADPTAGSRQRPDGLQVAWHTAIAGGTPSGILPFLIQDDTPRDRRIEPAREGLGRQARVKQVIVAVKNVETARQSFREMLDLEPRFVQNTTGDLSGYRVSARWGSLILAHPERGVNAMSDQLAQRGEGLYALTLAVEDVNRARSEITGRGIRVEDDASGFLIAPEAACGARIRLAQV
ncbi:MAG: VOC family protein [Chloroflexi bacterium]|nr:VOC family protein [Chloroflexota bacterium]